MRLDTKDARAQISRRRKSQGMHLAVAVICKFNSNYRHSSISAIFLVSSPLVLQIYLDLRGFHSPCSFLCVPTLIA